MKSGTLVMLVRYKNGCCVAAPKLGAIGTHIGIFGWVEGYHSVEFSEFPRDNGDTVWHCHSSEIIPISDPDIDISEKEDAPIKEREPESVN